MERIKNFFHYLFVPSEKNNFRARTIHHDLLTVYLLVAFLLVFFVKNLNVQLPNVLGFATDITTTKLFELTNKTRQENNLAPLVLNKKLEEAAAKKAQDMFTKNYWAHYSPDGETPWNFMLSANYHYEYAGENLAKNFLFSNNVVDAWMKSPTHRENMLRPEFTEVGYAVANGILNGEETTLVVQMFGKPAPVVAGTGGLGEAPNTNPAPETNNMVLAQSQTAPVQKAGLALPVVSLFIAFLLLVFALDFYFMARLNIVRLHGKSLAHIMFLLSIFVGLFFFLSKGAIL